MEKVEKTCFKCKKCGRKFWDTKKSKLCPRCKKIVDKTVCISGLLLVGTFCIKFKDKILEFGKKTVNIALKK